ncbi:MAG: hypothetical protein ABI343_06015 [Burkholderiaceae bacterium]
MVRDEQLISFAKKAGLYGNGLLPSRGSLLRFGKLVAAAERESSSGSSEPLLIAARDLLSGFDQEFASEERPELKAALDKLRSATHALDDRRLAPVAPMADA